MAHRFQPLLLLASSALIVGCSTVTPNQMKDPEARAVNAAVLSNSDQHGAIPKSTALDNVAKTSPDSDCIPNPDGSGGCSPTSAPLVLPKKKKN